jgi:hypothetical protein
VLTFYRLVGSQIHETAWFAVDLVNKSTFGKTKWAAGLTWDNLDNKGCYGLMAAMFEFGTWVSSAVVSLGWLLVRGAAPSVL